MTEDDNKLVIFDKKRKEIINLLSDNQIDKNEFLKMNEEFLNRLCLKPFSNINNFLQGLYNYQYYNLMAKEANDKANVYKNISKKKKLYQSLINQRENFYDLKDKSTLSMLEISNYRNVEAYFIDLLSKRLTGQIYEIVFKDHESVILHSKDKNILQKLRNAKVFDENIRQSLISDYVNKSYKYDRN